jgi:hypothetical protein
VRKCPNKKIPIDFLILICYNINTVREGKTKGSQKKLKKILKTY